MHPILRRIVISTGLAILIVGWWTKFGYKPVSLGFSDVVANETGGVDAQLTTISIPVPFLIGALSLVFLFIWWLWGKMIVRTR